MFNIFKMSNDTTAHMTVNNRVFIPGILPSIPVILVTPIKGQHISRCTIVSASNPAFAKTYGTEKFLAVTKEFMKLSHKEQLAELAWCWMDYNTTLAGLIDNSLLNGQLDSINVYFDYELENGHIRVINTDTEAIDKMCVIAGLVGKHAATAVATYHAHTVRRTASNMIDERAKEAKKAGTRPVAFQKKAFSVLKKEDTETNKVILKRSKAEGKEMLKAETAARSAEKKAAKVAKKAAADIAKDIENITSEEANGAEPNPA